LSHSTSPVCCVGYFLFAQAGFKPRFS
jgi:hypothetical protein